ncbi:MAG: hypothetical protein KME10_26055 [Plectolyngbya sp. WJT66-NPBG17]|jgi:hypothetical protein|nr:hypothetical protein [Plectolyngbya sp. WJT66-NPBG17]
MEVSLSALKQRRFSQQIKQTQERLADPQAWSILDQLEVPGFGTQLIRLFFPHRLAKQSAWGFGKPVHCAIACLIQKLLNLLGNGTSFWLRKV